MGGAQHNEGILGLALSMDDHDITLPQDGSKKGEAGERDSGVDITDPRFESLASLSTTKEA
jgi:hypothetical protein